MTSICVMGAGNFGTSLAQHAGRLGHKVMLGCRNQETADHINQHGKNPKYLSQLSLQPEIKGFYGGEDDVFRHSELIILAVPTQGLREVLKQMKPFLRPENKILLTCKGIEKKTYKFPSQIVGDILGKEKLASVAFLSGPSFAVEIASGQPTAVTVASDNREMALFAQHLLHSPKLRIYSSADIKGLEIAGALKNVIAISAGACEGLGFESNSRAALITRGLAEITRLGMAMGANPLTFTGLSGVGDLFLTCSSKTSRNYSVGYQLGAHQDRSLQEILSSLGSVAEGVMTTEAAYELAKKVKVRMPITNTVYDVLYKKKNIRQAVHDLISSHEKDEWESPS